MKNLLRISILMVSLLIVVAVGCTASASPKDLAKVSKDLTASQDQIKTGLTKVQADVAKAASSDDMAKVKADLVAVQAQLKANATQSDLVATQNQIKLLNSQVAAQSALSAYTIWYDQYYSLGNYKFVDTAAFNKKLGTLVAATSDDVTTKSWTVYLASDKANVDLIASHPTDYKTWNANQVAAWTKTTSDRYVAIGNVGTSLFTAISK